MTEQHDRVIGRMTDEEFEALLEELGMTAQDYQDYQDEINEPVEATVSSDYAMATVQAVQLIKYFEKHFLPKTPNYKAIYE